MKKITLFLLSFFLFTSCLGSRKSVERKYYMITYTLTDQEQAYKSPHYPYSVRIKRFDIDFTYDRQQIVYRHSPYMLEYYNFHLWVSKPAKMIKNLIYAHLKHSNLFHQVTLSMRNKLPDYEITGRINFIEELDSGTDWFAHLGMTLKLSEYKTGKVVLSYSFDKKTKVYKKNVMYMVRGLSRIMNKQINIFVKRVNLFFQEKKQGKRQGQNKEKSK